MEHDLDREDLEKAQAHQQSLDEQQELLCLEEQKEQVLWRLQNQIRDAVALCGVDDVERMVHETLDDIYCDSFK